MEKLIISNKLTIAPDYLNIKFVRSRGPGGQNVNKVNTRAQLSFNLARCDNLSPSVKARLVKQNPGRVNNNGIMIIQSDRHRHQQRNRNECLNRLRNLIKQALVPTRKRFPTKPPASANRNRLANKKHRSRIKNLRSSVNIDEK